MTKNYQLNELEIKHEQYLKVIHQSGTESSIGSFLNYLKVFEDGQADEFGPPVKEEKYEEHIIYALIQGFEFETWIWKFIVQEYGMDGMGTSHVSSYLIDHYGLHHDESWVLFWDLGDDVDPDEWYNQHLREEFGDGCVDGDDVEDDDDSIVVITLRGMDGGGYVEINTKGLKFDDEVRVR